MTMKTTRILSAAVLAAALVPSEAAAQLDPFLFLKRAEGNVLVLMDMSERMQRDGRKHDVADTATYYDPYIYAVKGGSNATWEAAIGLAGLPVGTKYRRKYVNLVHSSNADEKFNADEIITVPETSSEYATFESRTRLSVARTALSAAINQSKTFTRWGLLKMRQENPQRGTASGSGPVKILSNALQQATHDGFSNGKWTLTRTNVTKKSGDLTGSTAPLVSPTATSYSDVLSYLKYDVAGGLAASASKMLIPASMDDKTTVDAPIGDLLADAHTEALKLVVDTKCRNTVAILVTGGGEGNSDSGSNPVSTAAKFLLELSGRRVPIYVVAVALGNDATSDAERSQLRQIAAQSGGTYTEITKAQINAVAPGVAVPEFVRAINYAVSKTYIHPVNFNSAPDEDFDEGRPEEFQVTSPIVGTVNLEKGKDIAGNLLENSVIYRPGTPETDANKIPQRSNLLLTTGFELPGFYGRLRAFRVYKPVKDDAKPIGYRFVADGTRLWVGSVPAEAQRNIYTIVDKSMVAFTIDNAAKLAPYLRMTEAEAKTFITFVRSQPLGAVVSSTPVIMDPPSLDPPPDPQYPAFAEANKKRRSMVWVGANDGMLHGLDARSGVEMWAFIPFNLLPKLGTLAKGQPVDTFNFFVDSSPKVADVKVDGVWRTYLVVGQGAGGTFYQTFDVTLDGIGEKIPYDAPPADVLSYFATAASVPFKWSFPRFEVFDHTIGSKDCSAVACTADEKTYYEYMRYGDLMSTATAVEKSVGETWSDPAVGQIATGAGPYAVLVGSGFLKYDHQEGPNRKTVAGTTFYILDAKTGLVAASQAVGSDNKSEKQNDCRAASNCDEIKNALQADPVATGPADSRYITKAYIGDLDGRIWRFDIGLDSANAPKFMNTSATKLFDAGASHPLFTSMATVNVGGTQQYIFQGTGSDLLPSDGVSQQYKLLVVLDAGTTGTKTAEILLEKVDGISGDEKVAPFPAVAGDIVFFATTTHKATVYCEPQFDANLYAFTFIGGPAYDTNKDGTLSASKGDTPKVQATTGGRASAPFIVDQHLVFAAGGTIEMFGDPEDFNNGVGQAGVRILSWREVR